MLLLSVSATSGVAGSAPTVPVLCPPPNPTKCYRL